MAREQQPNKGLPSASEMSHYGGVPYTPPERVEHSHEHDAAPLSRAGRGWRTALAVVLVALAVLNIVRFVVLLTADGEPSTAGLIGCVVLAVLFLLYPVILVARMRRHTA